MNPSNVQQLIFRANAKSYLEMVELEIGSVSTFATTWTANLNTSTCSGGCSAKAQSIYERDLLESELTWFYPNVADTLNPPVSPLPYG